MNKIIFEKKDKVYGFISDKHYKPMKLKDIMIVLSVPKQETALLKQILDILIEEGKIVKTQRGKYAMPEHMGLFPATFQGNQSGFGFAILEDAEAKDVFIPKDFVNGAMHKDTVLIKYTTPEAEGKRAEGEIVKILERGQSFIVGTFEESQNFGFVVPDDSKHAKDIYVSNKHKGKAMKGHKVVVEIIKYPENDKKPEGKIVEIIGHISDPTTDILAIVRQYEIPTEFPSEVEKFLENIPTEVDEKDKVSREDLRDVMMVTIDGEDAKDLDDAISLEKLENGNYRLGVHIADVTNYIKEDSPMDKEALKRGTSVYLVDRVIPMIPRKLSNGICSLNANVDRLALSCIMDVDNKGHVISHRISQALINIDRRMTYTNVKKILVDEDKEVIEEYKEFTGFFKLMEELAAVLRTRRTERGAIDFDFDEAKIILDDRGKAIDIKPYERNVATHIIEEFMLLANETIAEDYFWQDIPFLYRTHEDPAPEKIQKLNEFMHNFGYSMKGVSTKIHPKDIQKVLKEIEGKDEEPIISRLALRSMKQARYTASCEGHFGLAAKYYSHFTSPIRRYPDLQIHRIIKENINNELKANRIKKLRDIMPEVAKQCSITERRAEDAERDTEKLKKVEYMEDKIGEEFDGVISSITGWGMYIELPNTVEGLVHVNNMKDDYYNYDEKLHVFVGERTSNVYKMGEKVKVKLIGTDKIRKTIDFKIVEKAHENK